MKKLVVGAVLGGLAMFVWSAISHMALPLGEAGLRSAPSDREPALVDAMRGALSERAIYFVPGMDMSRKPSAEEQKAWQARIAAGPTALVVYNPGAGQSLAVRPLLVELGFDVLACLVAAWVLAFVPASAGYWRRVLVVAAFGLFASFAIDGSYWNWYSFPTAYFAAQVVDGVVGAFVAGLVLARIVRA
jgi:hypothetical protein